VSATSQISVTNSAATAVVAQSLCKNIRVTENRAVANYPTTDFLVLKPGPSAVAVRLQSGAHYTFSAVIGWFHTGDIVGYLKTVNGTTTFDQDEDCP
jgi:hypothetical protein